MHLEKVYNVIPKLRSESISFQQLKESGSEHHDDAGTIKYHIHKCTNKLKRHETGGLKRRLHLAQAAEIIVWCSLRLSRERFKNNPADFISLRCVMENVGSRLFRSLTHSRELKMRSSAAKTWLLFCLCLVWIAVFISPKSVRLLLWTLDQEFWLLFKVFWHFCQNWRFELLKLYCQVLIKFVCMCSKWAKKKLCFISLYSNVCVINSCSSTKVPAAG